MVLLWAAALFAFRTLRPLNTLTTESFPVRPQFSGVSGVNLEASELTGERLEQTLAELEAGGIRWVRFTLPWDRVEPARGRFDWAQWDAVFAGLAKHPALEPVVVLDGSPAWAREPADADNPQAPPHERADFGAYAAAVSRRYGDRVRYYQVWHEPNIAPHWGARPPDPAGYLGLLREAAVQIRAADADAQVVLAALAPTTESSGINLSDITYLDALYSLGARAWFDVAAAEPYGFSAPPDAPADPARLNFARASLLRGVMLRHGDGDTPLWAAAFGWNAAPGPSSAAGVAPAPWGRVTEEEQARYAAQALGMARGSWAWLGPLFWAAYCPERPAGDPWLGFAVCDATGAPRPVWAGLAAAAAPAAVLPPGRAAVDHPALRYGPGWRVTPWAADPSADGDALEFAFDGSGLALRVQGGPYWAFYRITVDGRPANALPRDGSGAAYLVLHDPLAGTRWVTVARGLAPGLHQVRVEATGGWGQWALQGVEVTAAAGRPAWIAWLLLALALLATAAWAALAWPHRQGVSRRVLAQLDAEAAWPSAALWAAAFVSVLLLVLSRNVILDLAALALLGLLFLVRPDLSLPFIAASLPFWQRPEQLARWDFAHFEIFLWLGVLAAAARWAIGRLAGGGSAASLAPEEAVSWPRRWRISALDWPVLALLVSGLLSAIAAQEQGVAWREFRILFLGGALFYALITRAPWPAGRRFSPLPLLNGLLAGMVAVSLIGLWQLATGQGRVDVEGVWRVRALYGSPNNLALVLDRVVPLALALAAFGGALVGFPALQRGQGGPSAGSAFAARRQASTLLRWAYALAALIMALACVATFSKGALLLGLPAGVGLVLIGGARRSGRRWPLWLLAGLAAAGLLALALLFRTQRFADLLNFGSGTTFVRVNLWRGAWQMALAHPLLGVGPDNFLYAYRTRYALPVAWEELNLSHPHNIVLDLLTRLGVVGLLAAGWALIAGWLAGWRLFRRGAADVWPIALGLLGGLAATLAHGLIDNSLFLPDLMGLFVLTVGVLRRLEGGALTSLRHRQVA